MPLVETHGVYAGSSRFGTDAEHAARPESAFTCEPPGVGTGRVPSRIDVRRPGVSAALPVAVKAVCINEHNESIVAGELVHAEAIGAPRDIIVLRLSRTGQVLQTRIFSGPGDDRVAAIERTGTSGYLIVGTAGAEIRQLDGRPPLRPFAGGTDGLVLKLGSGFQLEWYTFLGGPARESLEGVTGLFRLFDWSTTYVLVGIAPEDPSRTRGWPTDVPATIAPVSGKRDGWILAINSAGRVYGQVVVSGPVADRLFNIHPGR